MKTALSTQSILQRSLWSLLALTVAIALGVLFFWGESVDELLVQIEPSRFLWALILLSLGLPTVAMRWRALLAADEQRRARPLFMTALLMVGHLLNVAAPGPIGEVAASWVVHKRYNVDFGNSLSALLVSRVLGLVSAFVIACGAFLVAPFEVAPEYIDKMWAVGSLLLILGLAVSTVVLFPHYPKNILRVLRTKAIFQRGFVQKLFDGVDKLLDSFLATAKRGLSAYAIAFAWCLAGHGLVAYGIYETVIALGYTVGVSSVFATYSGSIIFSLVMFLFPGSTFGFDVLFSGILHATSGLPLEVAVLVAAVIRFHQSLIAVIGGALMFFSSHSLIEEALAFGRAYILSEGVSETVSDKEDATGDIQKPSNSGESVDE